MKLGVLALSACAILVAPVASGQIIDTTLLNNTTNGAGDEPPGLTNLVSASSFLMGIDDPREAFGQNSGPIESGTFIFSDAFPVGTIHTLDFSTASAVFLNGLQVIGGGAGPGDSRRIMSLSLLADLDNNGTFETTLFTDPNFPDIGDGGPGMQIYSFAGITATRFRLAIEGQDGPGPRITEINAVVPEPTSIAFLATSAAALWLVARGRPSRDVNS